MLIKWIYVLIQISLITAYPRQYPPSINDGLYSIVAPGKLTANADYLLTIATNGGENETSVVATIECNKDVENIVSKFVINPNETRIVKIKVGNLKTDARYALNITGTGGISFTHSSPLHLEAKSVSLFIQTDKAMYKAGQNVMFRVVVVDQDLKPVENKQVDVQIKDANSNVIKKFALKSPPNGIISNELQLSDQPVLGDWILTATADETKEEKKFTIAEYVLPSFSVDIILPSFIIKKSPKLIATVKAMYTYGKPVKGELTLTATDNHSSYFNGTYSKRKRYELKSAIDGEYQFEISQETLTGGSNLFYQHLIDFEASVKDNLTGKVYNATNSLRVFEKKYKFELLENRKYKINSTYVNFVRVSYQDNTPVENSDKRLRLKYGYGWDGRNRRNIYETVPFNGIAKIEIPIEDTNETEPDFQPSYEQPIPYYPGYYQGVPSPLNTDEDGIIEENEYNTGNSTSFSPKPTPAKITLPTRAAGNTSDADANSTNLNFGSPNTTPILIRPPILPRPRIPVYRKVGRRPIDKSSISIEAVYDNEESYLATIYRSDDKNECSVNLKTVNESFNKVYRKDDEFEIEVTSEVEPLNEFFYEIVTRKGVVVAEKVSAVKLNSKSFVVKVTEEFYPKSNLVVHLFCKGKIVEKTMSINVDEVFDNKPIVSFSTNDTKPASTVNINIQAKPHSSVAILGFDQRMALLKSGNDIEKSTVTAAMEKQIGCDGSTQFSSCVENNYWIRYGTLRLNFEESGLIHFTNVQPAFDANPYPRHFFYSSGQRGFPGVPYSFNEDRYETVYDSEPEPAPDNTPVKNTANQKAVTIRQNFPETWLFDVIDTDENGVKSISRQIPDSITSWFITSFAINKEHGFGLTERTAKIKVFRPFFIRLSLPYSIIRGETVAIPMTVYNYLNRPEIAEIKMESNGDFEFVVAANEENEVSFSKKTKTKTVTVPANDGISVSFLIKPKKIGYITIKVVALSSSDADGVSEKLLVKPEGDNQFMNKAILLNLEGETVSETVDIEMPEQFVSDSERISVTAIGDIMGPAINNLDDLLRMPYGCGEQNMINFVPNIVVLDYLTKAGKLNEKIKSKAIKHIESGYQRELTYQHDDGSYSAFGKSDTHGSTWLTAFVHKSFIQARNYINIDEKLTNRSLQFLLSKQNEDGSFREDGRLLDSKMKGASGSNSVALTAYVFIALLINSNSNTPQMKKTETYLLNQLNATQNVYEIAIITYAFHLSGSLEKESAFRKLMSVSRSKSGLTYWTQDDKSDAAAVEMTSYALMTLVHRDNTIAAVPVLRYLVSKQNSNGGFSSTQDTVIGIQALSAFAGKVSNKLPKISIEVETHESKDEKKNLAINSENSIVLQELSLSANTRKVTLSATGEGSAIMQLSWQYNVIKGTADPAFAIRYKIEDGTADNILVINVFTKYLKGKVSGMAVMELTLPSGFTADVEALHDLKKSGVKRVETKDEDTIVVIYFDEITDEELSVKVVAERKVKVANLKSVPITVYDYYDKSKTATVFYAPENTSVCDICENDDCGKSCS